jgi:hypothetical protein
MDKKVKAKASLSTPWRHIAGSRGIAPLILNLGTRWRWVVCFTPLPLYPRQRSLVPIKQKAGWALEPVWTFWWREKSLFPTAIRTPNWPARSPFAIPTMLLRLRSMDKIRQCWALGMWWKSVWLLLLLLFYYYYNYCNSSDDTDLHDISVCVVRWEFGINNRLWYSCVQCSRWTFQNILIFVPWQKWGKRFNIDKQTDFVFLYLKYIRNLCKIYL